MTSNWFSSGDEAVEYAEKQRDNSFGAPFRFWMRAGTSTKIIFLDDFNATRTVTLPSGERREISAIPFLIDEHQITISGDFNNYKTCIAKMEPCPLCLANHRASTTGFFTVLAMWVDDKGKERWQKKLYPAKLKALDLIRNQRNLRKDGQLQYAGFQVARNSKKDLRTGNDLNFVDYVPVERIMELAPKFEGEDKPNIAPYDYAKILVPDSADDLRALLQSGVVAPPKKYGAPDNSDQDVNNSADSTGQEGEQTNGNGSSNFNSPIPF